MHKREVKVFHVTDFLRQSIGKSRKKKMATRTRF